MHEFYVISAQKNIKMRKFIWYFPEKLTKFTNFTIFTRIYIVHRWTNKDGWMIFARNMLKFYMIIARKILSPIFFLGGGVPPAP